MSCEKKDFQEAKMVRVSKQTISRNNRKGRIMQELAPGTKLNQRYKILRTLGRGGFAFTYEAIQEPIHLRVCIKELSASGIKEGEILASIQSPHVVRVLDYFEENGNYYIVLEYLEGQTLLDYVKEKGCLAPEDLFAAARQLLAALSEIHSLGLIHRDIAPDNIMVLSQKDTAAASDALCLKLLDFGTARAAGLSQYTCTLKDGYTPIEQLTSDVEQGAFTDIYALSAVLYYCLTGKKPQGAYSRLLDDDLKKPSDLGVVIKDSAEKIILKGLSLQPGDRYQSAKEMLDAIEKAFPEHRKSGVFSEAAAGKAATTDKAAKKNLQNRRRLLPEICTAAALAVAVFFLLLFVFPADSGTTKYDPESMYQVRLTPTDEFTVAGYNESIEVLKERLKLFSATSGSYSLQEDSGIITLLLNKEDFPQNEAEDKDYQSTTYEYQAIPEYVLRAYLSRAAALTLKQTGGDATIPLEQIRDFSVSVKEDGLTLGLNVEKYISIDFSETFLLENKAVLAGWNKAYSLQQDSDCSPPVTPYTILPKKDDSGFYLLTDDDSDTLFEILNYNLTHAPLEHSFDISMEEQTDWQKKENTEVFGASQTEEKALSSDTVSYYIYGSMSAGEELDCFTVLRNRLDTLGSPYALGTMDSLSAVTAGCDSPIYTFLGVKGQDRLQYTDIADLALCSNQFFLSASDGQYSDYITSCFLSEGEISIHADAFAQQFSEDSGEVYLMAVNGFYDQTPLMKGELGKDGAFHFTAFANETAAADYPWVIDLIAACIKNQAPVTLSSYSVETEEASAMKLSELGLFQTE